MGDMLDKMQRSKALQTILKIYMQKQPSEVRVTSKDEQTLGRGYEYTEMNEYQDQKFQE